MGDIERKIDSFLKINDRLPAWVKMIIYYVLTIAEIFIGYGVVSVVPDVLKDFVSFVFIILAACLMMATAWQFGNIWAGRGFCTVMHRLIIIGLFIIGAVVFLYLMVYAETACSC